jgi:hypothetical protein
VGLARPSRHMGRATRIAPLHRALRRANQPVVGLSGTLPGLAARTAARTADPRGVRPPVSACVTLAPLQRPFLAPRRPPPTCLSWGLPSPPPGLLPDRPLPVGASVLPKKRVRVRPSAEGCQPFDMFRLRGFSPPCRLAPVREPRACCIPQPTWGFAAFPAFTASRRLCLSARGTGPRRSAWDPLGVASSPSRASPTRSARAPREAGRPTSHATSAPGPGNPGRPTRSANGPDGRPGRLPCSVDALRSLSLAGSCASRHRVARARRVHRGPPTLLPLRLEACSGTSARRPLRVGVGRPRRRVQPGAGAETSVPTNGPPKRSTHCLVRAPKCTLHLRPSPDRPSRSSTRIRRPPRRPPEPPRR